MAELLACPFCRELFSEADGRTTCPTCEVELRPLHLLPPSAESRLEREAEIEATPPEWRRLSFWDLRRGRGALAFLSLLGLTFFFQPWFTMIQPETATFSGFHLARYYAGWLWGGAVGWFVLLPLVLTRRTIGAMRGVRIVCTLFASLTCFEILLLTQISPASTKAFRLIYEWRWGVWASAITSAIGAIIAAFFGGRVPQSGDALTKVHRVAEATQTSEERPPDVTVH